MKVQKGGSLMTLLEVIKMAPQVINHIIDDNKVLIEEKLQSYLGLEKIKRVVVVASGSSYNAAFVVKTTCGKKCGVDMELVYPNVFNSYTDFNSFSGEDLFIFISQGGETKEVYHGLQRVKELGFKNLVITEKIDGSVANIADVVIPMGTNNEPYLFRTIGYDATCVTLTLVLKTVFNPDNEEIIEDFNKTAANLDKMVEQGRIFFEENREALMASSVMVFTGSHDLWPVAQEAAIKFMEMVPLYTLSYELEESIHGPQNAFDAKASYFISHRAGEDDERAMAIHQFLKSEISPSSYLITSSENAEQTHLRLSDSRFNYLEYITFYQSVAYYLSVAKGRDLRKITYPQLTHYIQKKFED